MISSPSIKQNSRNQPSFKNNNLIPIIPIILIFLVITLSSSTVYFAYQVSSLKQQLNNFPTPPITSISPSPTPTIQTNLFQNQNQVTNIPTSTLNPTADWKTYTNTAFNYQFRYPTDWSDITDNKNKGNEVSIISPDKEILHATIFSNQQSTDNNPTQKTFTFYRNNQRLYLMITLVECEGPGCGFGKNVNTFNQILSTFKFTNSTIPTLTPTPTPDYLSTTYTDKYFNYQISYNNKNWFFRRTFGPDINHNPPSDIISGIDLHRGWPSNINANININLLDTHGLTDTETWITKYELNPPLNSNKQSINFNNYPAILYTYRLKPDRVNQEIYFIAKEHLYHIYAWELGEKFGPEITSILDSINP